MRVLVTGHKGYIGGVLVPALQQAGHAVTGLDSCWFAEGCNLVDIPDDVLTLDKDVRDVSEADLDGFDAVVHLAGLCNDPLGNIQPERTHEINHEASVRLARMARARGVQRFVFYSSCSVYGSSDGAFLMEEAPAQPITPYAEAKIWAERDISRLATDRFTPVFLRNATAYGVSPRLRLDLVLNNLVGWADTTGHVLILSDGTPWRPIVHIQDISQATIAVLNAPTEVVHNEIFNVGRTEENYQVRELAAMIQDLIPGCTVEYAEGGGPDPRCYRVDCAKYERTFPDHPLTWDARQGIQELHEAFRRHNVTEEEMDGARFIRLNKVRELQDAGFLDDQLRWTARRGAVNGVHTALRPWVHAR